MSYASHFVDVLKRALRERGLTYLDVAQALGLSEAAVKKSFASGRLTLDRVEAVATLAGLTFPELVRLTERALESRDHSFSEDQELALAADEKLFAYLYLLLSGLKPDDIKKHYRFAARESERCLLELDKLRLIDLRPSSQVRLRVPSEIVWREAGPLKRRYDGDVKREFLSSAFQEAAEKMRLSFGRVRESQLPLLMKKIDALVQEFQELAGSAPGKRVPNGRAVWLLIALRPWTFSVIRKLQRQAGAGDA